MAHSSAFRLLDLHEALCYLKIFTRPPPPEGRSPKGGGGRSHMYLNPDRHDIPVFFFGYNRLSATRQVRSRLTAMVGT